MPKEIKEKVVSFYDPVRQAYCDMPVSVAKKLIAEAKKLEAVLVEDEKLAKAEKKDE